MHRQALSFAIPTSLLVHCAYFNHLQISPSRQLPTYLSLRMRRNFLYGIRPVSSSQLLHQLHQPEQVLIAKKASAAGHRHKRIWRRYCGPARGNRAQTAFSVVEVNPILAPVVAIRDQLELLASQRMVRMGYLETGIGNVAMRCS
jgi:hypothetical protein